MDHADFCPNNLDPDVPEIPGRARWNLVLYGRVDGWVGASTGAVDGI